MSLDQQIKKLQRLIHDRDLWSRAIETSFSRLITMIHYNSEIEIRSDLNELYRRHQSDLKLKQESLDKCNRDIESLLKIMMRDESSDDKITKMILKCDNYEFTEDDCEELTLEQLARINPIISLNEVDVIATPPTKSFTQLLLDDCDELTPEQLTALEVRIAHNKTVPSGGICLM